MADQYTGTKICGVEATLAIGEEVQKFVNREVVYQIQGTLPGLSAAGLNAAFVDFSTHISSKCGAKFSQATPGGNRPNIIVTFGQIDGQGKTLGWSELRNSESWQVTQKHDNAERWSLASNAPADRISWWLVAIHETIHSLGAPHLTGGIAIMNPIYNASLTRLQTLDISWLVSAYGESVGGGLPPPIGETLLGNLYIDGNGFLKVRKA